MRSSPCQIHHVYFMNLLPPSGLLHFLSAHHKISMSKNFIIIFRVRCTKQPRAAVLGVIIILCLFVVYPQTEKKKNYTVHEFSKLEYCVNFFFF